MRRVMVAAILLVNRKFDRWGFAGPQAPKLVLLRPGEARTFE
jgi:hypothetical protein